MEVTKLVNIFECCLTVARCQSDMDVEVAEAAEEAVEEGSDLGIVGDDIQDFGDGSFSPAPDVETVCVFPKNPSRCENLINLVNDVFFFWFHRCYSR